MQTEDKQRFRDMQEHPEKYSDEQVEAMMNQLDQTPDVEEAWQQFEAQHHLQQPHHHWTKIAASFIGILMASGITLAAIHLVRYYQKAETIQMADTTAVANSPRSALNSPIADTLKMESRIFNNVPLDTMLLEMASYYHVSIQYEREKVRQLRFHFVWKRTDSLDHLVEKLNNFESVNIIHEHKTLIVR